MYGAESEGFEPPVPRRVQQISSLPRSTTLATFHASKSGAKIQFFITSPTVQCKKAFPAKLK